MSYETIRVGSLGIMMFYDPSVPEGHVRLLGKDYPLESTLAAIRGPEPPIREEELQAILRPLLEDPMRMSYECEFGCPHMQCLFCDNEGWHAPDCPVLRKDELLAQ